MASLNKAIERIKEVIDYAKNMNETFDGYNDQEKKVFLDIASRYALMEAKEKPGKVSKNGTKFTALAIAAVSIPPALAVSISSPVVLAAALAVDGVVALYSTYRAITNNKAAERADRSLKAIKRELASSTGDDLLNAYKEDSSARNLKLTDFLEYKFELKGIDLHTAIHLGEHEVNKSKTSGKQFNRNNDLAESLRSKVSSIDNGMPDGSDESRRNNRPSN